MSYLVPAVPALPQQSVYAAGTAYALTATPALLDFGTTDPTITLAQTGTYLLMAAAGLKLSAATFVAVQTVTLKLRRTNNTAADLTNGSRAVALSIVTTITAGVDTCKLPPVLYDATAGDVIQIFGSISVVPSVGTVDVVSAEIVALRVA